MIRAPPVATSSYTTFPSTTLFRARPRHRARQHAPRRYRAAPAPDRPPDAPPPWSRRRSNRGPPRRRRSSLEGSRSFFLLKCVQPGCDVGHLVVDETAILADTLFGAVVDPHRRHPDRFGGRKVARHVVAIGRAHV